MRRRVDSNQREIVACMRNLGATVAITSMVGKGYPDISVGYRGINLLVEIKDGAKPPSQTRLTPDEQSFHDNWRGQISIVYSMDDAIKLITNLTKSFT